MSEENKYQSAYLDLEPEIRDLMHMASIAVDLATDLIGQLGEYDGKRSNSGCPERRRIVSCLRSATQAAWPTPWTRITTRITTAQRIRP